MDLTDPSSRSPREDVETPLAAKAGRKEQAITCYRKSLELNPGNKNGRGMLEKLEKNP